jgi:hypothetical protein
VTAGLWETVGSIVVAAVAAAGSAVGIVMQYQGWRRKRQPVIADRADWQNVVSAQQEWLAHVETQLRLLSPAPDKVKLLARTDADNAAVNLWLKQPEENTSPLLRLREGRKALAAYRDLAAPFTHLRKLADEANDDGRRVGRVRASWRRLARTDIASIEGRAIKSLLMVQKHLTEISYLQPALLGSGDAKASESETGG